MKPLEGLVFITSLYPLLSHLHAQACYIPIGRTLQYKAEINDFVMLCANQDLCHLKLSEDKWSSIKLISGWLEKF